MAQDEASTPGPDKGTASAEGERAHGTKRFYGAVKVGARGQIVLPAEARSDFAIAAGARLLVFGDLEQGLWIAPVDVLQRTMEGTTAFYRMIAPAMSGNAAGSEDPKADDRSSAVEDKGAAFGPAASSRGSAPGTAPDDGGDFNNRGPAPDAPASNRSTAADNGDASASNLGDASTRADADV